jgi:general stress protein CsbA
MIVKNVMNWNRKNLIFKLTLNHKYFAICFILIWSATSCMGVGYKSSVYILKLDFISYIEDIP